MSKENPFRGISIEDVRYAEANYYVIKVENDFYSVKGKLAFNKTSTIKHYNTVLDIAAALLESKDDKDITRAHEIYSTIQILPLRIN